MTDRATHPHFHCVVAYDATTKMVVLANGEHRLLNTPYWRCQPPPYPGEYLFCGPTWRQYTDDYNRPIADVDRSHLVVPVAEATTLFSAMMADPTPPMTPPNDVASFITAIQAGEPGSGFTVSEMPTAMFDELKAFAAENAVVCAKDPEVFATIMPISTDVLPIQLLISQRGSPTLLRTTTPFYQVDEDAGVAWVVIPDSTSKTTTTLPRYTGAFLQGVHIGFDSRVFKEEFLSEKHTTTINRLLLRAVASRLETATFNELVFLIVGIGQVHAEGVTKLLEYFDLVNLVEQCDQPILSTRKTRVLYEALKSTLAIEPESRVQQITIVPYTSDRSLTVYCVPRTLCRQ